jgi:hypothetical protein
MAKGGVRLTNNSNSNNCSINNCNNDCNYMNSSIFDCLFTLDPKQFTLFSAILGILIAENFDINQQNVLGEFFSNIGQTISTLAAQGELLQSNDSKSDNISRQIKFLKKQICALEQELNK